MRTLDKLVREYLADKSEKTLHGYLYAFNYGIQAIRELHVTTAEGINTCEVELSSAKTVDLDRLPDYVSWTKIGVRVGDRVHRITQDGTIAFLSDGTQRDPEVRLVFANDLNMTIPTSFVSGRKYTLEVSPTGGATSTGVTVSYNGTQILSRADITADNPSILEFTADVSDGNLVVDGGLAENGDFGLLLIKEQDLTDFEELHNITCVNGGEIFFKSNMQKKFEYLIEMTVTTGSVGVTLSHEGTEIAQRTVSAGNTNRLYYKPDIGSGNVKIEVENTGVNSAVNLLIKEPKGEGFNRYKSELDSKRFSNYWNYDNYLYDFHTVRDNQYGYRHNTFGYFREDKKNNLLQFTSEVDSTVYLEYVSNGQDGCFYSNYRISDDVAQTMKKYIAMKEAISKYGESHKEAQVAIMAYNTEFRNYRDRNSDLDFQTLIDIIGRGQHINN
ncbi:MAG: hypothetical protein F6K19_01740 [Cyanothece sp. SIO1E1]|nr:hypothetical protein [Cyanothece sp. SIO1E1]